MVISNHFLCKDLVHHPIETSIYSFFFPFHQSRHDLDVAPSQDSSDHQDDITFLIGNPNQNLNLPLLYWEPHPIQMTNHHLEHTCLFNFVGTTSSLQIQGLVLQCCLAWELVRFGSPEVGDQIFNPGNLGVEMETNLTDAHIFQMGW